MIETGDSLAKVAPKSLVLFHHYEDIAARFPAFLAEIVSLMELTPVYESDSLQSFLEEIQTKHYGIFKHHRVRELQWKQIEEQFTLPALESLLRQQPNCSLIPSYFDKARHG